MLTTKEIIEVMNGPDPVSIIRCGDGEKVCLEDWGEKLNDHYLRIFGYIPTEWEKLEIRSHLMKAISYCDILGVPDHDNLEEMDEDWRDVEKIIDQLIPQPTKKRCSVNIHLDLLESNSYKEFLKKPFAYIGCRNLNHQLIREFNTSVYYCSIPPERRFTTYSGPNHYPDRFNEVKGFINEFAEKDRVLLVGAGIVGKIYCNWWRDKGGKALDIGSVMDEWAGAATRGPKRGLDKYVRTKWTL